MLAVIRARFTPTPPNAVWSDAAFAAWLDPHVRYSLANYWTKSTFGKADLSYQLLQPIVLDDPRNKLSAQDRQDPTISRPCLVNAITAKLSDEQSPDWIAFDGMIIWFAKTPTDQFGGGPFP